MAEKHLKKHKENNGKIGRRGGGEGKGGEEEGALPPLIMVLWRLGFFFYCEKVSLQCLGVHLKGIKVHLILKKFIWKKKKNKRLVKKIESPFNDPKSLKITKTHFYYKLKNEAFVMSKKNEAFVKNHFLT